MRVVVVLAALGMAVAVAAAVWPGGSQAAAATPTQRTFVSTSGDDAKPCTRAEPCRNFAAALPNTLSGGEVVALDSGGYGPLTIDKSVSVIGAPGVHAAITAFSGNAVTVSAGSADTVVLRNLYLSGLGGDNGIRFFSGGVLHVESVTATGFTNRGIRVTCDTDGDTAATMVVRDSVFRHNNGGVIMNGTNCDLQVQIERTRADSNTLHGFWFLGPVHGSVGRSTASGNTGSGYFFQPEAVVTVSDSRAERNGFGMSFQDPGTGVQVTAERVVLSNNSGTGVSITGGVFRIGGSTVTGSQFGLWNFGGTLETFQDNVVRGNDQNVAGVITAVAKT